MMNKTISPQQLVGQLNWRYATKKFDSTRDMLVGGLVKAQDQPGRQAWAARQATIALGNLLTSAALLGIDACPMEGFVPAQYDAILGLEEKGLASVAICALGYRATTDAYAALRKVRFPKETVLFHV